MPFYAKNQLVWVKIKGYPWWPAIVAKSNQTRQGVIEDEVLVNFIGENSHAEVHVDKVADFEEHFDEYNVGKSKKLQDSIKIAMNIMNGESTYEAERSRLNKTSRRRDQSEESASEKEIKTTKTEPKKKENKEIEKKGSPKPRPPSPKLSQSSPKVSRVNSKSKEEEKEAKPFRENSSELSDILHSITRSRSRKDHIEMLTEPLIYNSRKNKNVASKLTFKSLSKESIIKKNKAILSKESDDDSSDDDNENDSQRSKKMRANALGKSKLVSKALSRQKSSASDNSAAVSSEDEDKTSNTSKMVKKQKEKEKNSAAVSSDDEEEKTSLANKIIKKQKEKEKEKEKPKEKLKEKPKEKVKEKEQRKEKPREKKPSVKKESVKKSQKAPKNIDLDLELAKELEDIDDEEEYESFDLNIEACEELELGLDQQHSVTSEKDDNNVGKRSREKEPKAPIYAGKTQENVETNKEVITKKLKASPKSGESMGALMDNHVGSKIVVSYNSAKIKKLEKNLQNILHKVFEKFQRKEKSKDDEESAIQLINLIKEIEESSFTGTEYTNSELGKLFKTIQFLFILNKELLSKTEEILVLSLARILHKIKSKILQHCLDNTEYIDSLNLPAEHEGLLTPPTDVTPITIDDVRTKIEELNFGAHHPVINMEHPQIRTKMEEEMNVNLTGKTPVRMPIKNEDNMVSPPSNKEGKKGDNFHLRKKICQKFAALLQKVYSMEKDKSQDLTLVIEDKINSFYQTSINEYKQAIKNLLKLIKANKLEVEELVQTQEMEAGQFASLLKYKFRMLSDFLGSPENSTSGTDNKDKTESKKNKSIVQNLGLREKEEVQKRAQTMIITKVEDKYNANVKQEADEASMSYQYIKYPGQNSF